MLSQLDLPTTVYAATARDIFRKPRAGMWEQVCQDYDIPADEVDLAGSVFVGDAGGRTAQLKNGETGAAAVAKDFSCSDRNLAHNVGITYKTPEEFFLGEPPREFARDFDLAVYPYPKSDVDGEGDGDVLLEKVNKQDIVLFCGPPGAGKSTFYWRHLKRLNYERVNQDTLKSRAKCFKAAADLLDEGTSIVIGRWPCSPSTYYHLIGPVSSLHVGLTKEKITRTPMQTVAKNGSISLRSMAYLYVVSGLKYLRRYANTTTSSGPSISRYVYLSEL